MGKHSAADTDTVPMWLMDKLCALPTVPMARVGHNHIRFRNDDGPWSNCPPDCPALE